LCRSCEVRVVPDSSAITSRFSPVNFARSRDHDARLSAGDAEYEVGQLEVEVHGGDEPREFRQTIYLFVQCNSEQRGRLEIPVHWTVASPLEVTPSRLSLGLVGLGAELEKTLVVKSTDKRAFRITGLSLDTLRLVSFSLSEGAALVHRVTVRLEIPRGGYGVSRGILRLETDHPELTVIHVPISAMVRGKVESVRRE